MEWFRFHTNTIDSKKIQALPAAVVKVWVNFLCLNKIYGGRLPDVGTIAFRLRASDRQAGAWLKMLRELGLVDDLSDGTVTMHDWDEWQRASDDSAERKRRQRARQSRPLSRDTNRDMSRDSHGQCLNVEETRPDIETRREQTDTSVTVTSNDWQMAEWGIFESEYPGLIGQMDLQVFLSVIDTPEEAGALRSGLAAWKQCERWRSGFVKDAKNYLSERLYRSKPPADKPVRANRSALQEALDRA